LGEWQHPKTAEIFKKLGLNVVAHFHPGWSPDRRYLIFMQFDSATGCVNVFAVDFDQGQIK
jgi:Tol biopolymer transport system component